MAIQLEPKEAEPKETPGSILATPAASFQGAAGHLVAGIQAMFLGAVLTVGFWPVLAGIYWSWFDERVYMEHGILVAPAVAYMVWAKRGQLAALAPRPSLWGMGLIAWGALQVMLGDLGQWVWVSRMAFLVSLLGCILLVYGVRIVKELAYPLGTLILMITPPNFVFERLTLRLQLLASGLGATALEGLGYSVLREGNVIEMVGIKLSVEEACSGIRSLNAIIFLCVLYNYFFVQKKSMRIWILVCAIPIAILGNAVRIVASGVAGQYNHAWVTGATHEAFGYVSVVVAAAGCVGVHLALLRFEKMRLAKMRDTRHA